ncbi:isoprenylcysteine carboxylmethyltransferase family protein [Chitinispirillales bacterium ANBcel5]|uniref:methyltransferase family protein n=1 Tax=Cellulosispirillum alkaliphilum TaxID=3039283 RepID=UPI002A55C4D7|nr:isoprenylcysteine carboxylmethyltransferase family protein [Chitinispirillales bacterium ANBcel5]
MKKTLITTVYIIVFWFLLPFFILFSSNKLDKRGLSIRRSNTKAITGGLIFLLSASMLWLSITEFSKGAKKLPISALPPYDKLVTRGVYNVWRHPIYLFYTLCFVGIGVLVGSGGLLFVVLPVFMFFELIHAFVEERFLTKKHGDAYDEYRKRSSLIIPKKNSVKSLLQNFVS